MAAYVGINVWAVSDHPNFFHRHVCVDKKSPGREGANGERKLGCRDRGFGTIPDPAVCNGLHVNHEGVVGIDVDCAQIFPGVGLALG
jgi:hypothetical protein